MIETLTELRKTHIIGFVGGSDLKKQHEQLGGAINLLDYWFSENGVVAAKDGVEFHRESIGKFLGEEKLKIFIKFVLSYIINIDIPVQRGTFIEYRSGLINISPIGRNCSREERNAFEEYDKIHGIRAKFVKVLEAQFPDWGIQFSIGGQISFDVFPKGWDKTYCLKFLEEFKEIHFFGDKTYEGGNDYELFEHERTIGHAVKCPADTIADLKKLGVIGN